MTTCPPLLSSLNWLPGDHTVSPGPLRQGQARADPAKVEQPLRLKEQPENTDTTPQDLREARGSLQLVLRRKSRTCSCAVLQNLGQLYLPPSWYFYGHMRNVPFRHFRNVGPTYLRKVGVEGAKAGSTRNKKQLRTALSACRAAGERRGAARPMASSGPCRSQPRARATLASGRAVLCF